MLHKALAVAVALVLLVPVVSFAAPCEQERSDAGAQTVAITGDLGFLVQYVVSLLPPLGPASVDEFDGPTKDRVEDRG